MMLLRYVLVFTCFVGTWGMRQKVVLEGDSHTQGEKKVSPQALEWALHTTLEWALHQVPVTEYERLVSPERCQLNPKQALNSVLFPLQEQWKTTSALSQVKQFDFTKLEAEEDGGCGDSNSGSVTIIGSKGWILKSEEPERLAILEKEQLSYAARFEHHSEEDKAGQCEKTSHIMRYILAFELKCGGETLAWTVMQNIHPNPRKDLLLGYYDIKPSREMGRCHNSDYGGLVTALKHKIPGKKLDKSMCAGFLGDWLAEIAVQTATGRGNSTEVGRRECFMRNLLDDLLWFHKHPDKLVDYSYLVFVQEVDLSIATAPNVFMAAPLAGDPKRRPLQVVIGVIDFLKPKGRWESRYHAAIRHYYPYLQTKFEHYAFYSFCNAGLLLDWMEKGDSPACPRDMVTWNPKPVLKEDDYCSNIAACRGLTRTQSTGAWPFIKPKTLVRLEECQASADSLLPGHTSGPVFSGTAQKPY